MQHNAVKFANDEVFNQQIRDHSYTVCHRSMNPLRSNRVEKICKRSTSTEKCHTHTQKKRMLQGKKRNVKVTLSSQILYP